MGRGDARQRRGEACAGDQDLQASLPGAAAVLRHGVRVAVRGANLELVGNPAALELVERRLHPLPVRLGPDEDADLGALSRRHAGLARRPRRAGSARRGS